MSFTPRGLRLINCIKQFSGTQSCHFDFKNIFDKIQFTAMNDECLNAKLKVDKDMCNLGNVLHGGYIATLMDVACVYMLIGRTNGRVCWTTNMNINFISAAAEGETLTIEAKPLKTGNFPLMEALLTKENGIIVAKGVAAFLTGNQYYQENFKLLTQFDVFQN